MKKRDDLKDVIHEERSRGRRQPVDTDAVNQQAERRRAVLRILRNGTKDDLRELLEVWGYSAKEIEEVLNEYDAALGRRSF